MNWGILNIHKVHYDEIFLMLNSNNTFLCFLTDTYINDSKPPFPNYKIFKKKSHKSYKIVFNKLLHNR